MTKSHKLNAKNQSIYNKILSQVKWSDWEAIRLDSVDFHCPVDVIEYPMEPVESIDISWKYSFEKTDNGFYANVLIMNEITSNDGMSGSIDLVIGYNLYYVSEMDLPGPLVEKFAYEKVLPHVWPYFRENARELYFKAGLKWVIIPAEPNVIAEE